MRTDRGVLYVALGEVHERMAVRSARSVRAHDPELPIMLICGSDATGEGHDAFDHIETCEGPFSWPLRVRSMMRTPFERTLFLDADTLVMSSVSPALDVLDNFDVALAYAPVEGLLHDPDGLAPDCFHMPNTGIIAFRREPAVERWIPLWLELYERGLREYEGDNRFVMDQPAAGWALWRTGLRVWVLPPEWNVRGRHPAYLKERPVIVHELVGSLERMAEAYGWRAGPRVFSAQSDVHGPLVVDGVGRAGAWAQAFTDGILRSFDPEVVVEFGLADASVTAFFAHRYPSARVLCVVPIGEYTSVARQYRHLGNVRVIAADADSSVEQACERAGVERASVLRKASSFGAPLDVSWAHRRVEVVVYDGEDDAASLMRSGFERADEGCLINPASFGSGGEPVSAR